MQQRSEPHESLDDFPTPPWATRALCEQLKLLGFDLPRQSVWEPACNRGYMARVLDEYFETTYASDIHDYGYSQQNNVLDFLIGWDPDVPHFDWLITNPPFRLAVGFIIRGLLVADYVAVLVRSAFDEGQNRYKDLFQNHPEIYAMPFVERVVMWQGVLLDPDVKVWQPAKDGDGGKMVKPSTATAYQWLIFGKNSNDKTQTIKKRIAPCRKLLTQIGDYPSLPDRLLKPEGKLI